MRLRLTYQCFNGENNTKSIKITSEIYKNVPAQIEFRLPDGSTFAPAKLTLDDNGQAEYSIPKEMLYQNGEVQAQASVYPQNGKIEKSSIISFPIMQSINATDDYTILLRNNRLYPYGGNTLSCIGDNSKYQLKFVGVDGLSSVFAIFRREGQQGEPILLDENNCAKIPSWVLKEGGFEVGLRAEGFASTPLEILVQRSIVEKSDIIKKEDNPTMVEQLFQKLDNIRLPLTTALSPSSTDQEAPSAKCVYEAIDALHKYIEEKLEERGGD